MFLVTNVTFARDKNNKQATNNEIELKGTKSALFQVYSNPEGPSPVIKITPCENNSCSREYNLLEKEVNKKSLNWINENRVIITAPMDGTNDVVDPEIEAYIGRLRKYAKKNKLEFLEPYVFVIDPKQLEMLSEKVDKVNELLNKLKATYDDASVARQSLDNKQNELFKKIVENQITAEELIIAHKKGEIDLSLLSNSGRSLLSDGTFEKRHNLITQLENELTIKKKEKKSGFFVKPKKPNAPALATFAGKIVMQATLCTFIITMTDAFDVYQLSDPNRLYRFFAFELAVTTALNVFIETFLNLKTAAASWVEGKREKIESSINSAEAMRRINKWLENNSKFIDSEISKINEMKSNAQQGKPWFLKRMFDVMYTTQKLKILPKAAANTIVKAPGTAARFMLRGDMITQTIVIWIIVGASWGTIGLSNEIQAGLTSNFALNGLILLSLAGFEALKNAVSAVPVDLLVLHLRRLKKFYNKTSFWWGFIPETVYQKDKFAKLGLSGASSLVNFIVGSVSIPLNWVIATLNPTIPRSNVKNFETKQNIEEMLFTAKLYKEAMSNPPIKDAYDKSFKQMTMARKRPMPESFYRFSTWLSGTKCRRIKNKIKSKI